MSVEDGAITQLYLATSEIEQKTSMANTTSPSERCAILLAMLPRKLIKQSSGNY